MTATAPSVAATRVRRDGPWHRQVAGLHVLKVQGSYRAMGRQHGELLRPWVARGPLPYYRTYLEKLLGGAQPGPAARLAWPLLNHAVGTRVARALPEFATETLRGLAEGADLPYRQVLAGATMPDAILWFASRLMQLKRVPAALDHRLQMGLGCTSAIAWGEATADGALLHARNFDYHGVGCWPKTAAVVFHQPDAGLRYVSVAAAGIPLGGVTAMNEAGLSLTVHQHMFSDGAALGGTPIGLVGDLIMRGARSLDDAEAILRAHRPIGCWTYLVTDGHRREVLCWEENPRRQAPRRLRAEGTFGYANVYLDEALGATERQLYGSYWRHNRARHQRANALLEAGRGRLDPAGMAGILGDTGESGCRLHAAIAMLMTVGSVVFRPEDGVLWVGTGEAPTSHGTFVPFELGREDHAPERGELTPQAAPDAPARAAFDAYRRAYLAYIDEGDVARSRALLEEACALAPEQPLYHAVRGLLALRLEDPRGALEALGRALALGHPDPERVAAFHLWHGRALDLEGARDGARAAYTAALAGPADEPVRRAAQRGLGRRYRARAARRLHVDFAFADVMVP